MTSPARLARTLQQHLQDRDEMLRHCNAHEIRAAEAMVQRFMHRDASRYYDLPLTWPDAMGTVGKATRIGYRSDKFDGTWRDYTHKHESPLPDIYAPYDEAMAAMGRYPIEPGPQPRALSILGYVLEIEYPDPSKRSGVGHHDFKGEAYLPFMCGCPRTHTLYVVPQCGGWLLALRSRIMRIQREGIVN